MAEAIVGGALLRVAQDAVRFGGFLEFFLGLVIAGIAIGMVLQRQLAVGGLERRLVAIAGDAENFVIIAFGHVHVAEPIWNRAHRDLHHGGTQQPALEIVASLVLFEHGVIGGLIGFDHFDGVMNVRIERLSRGYDRLQAQLLQGVVQPLVDQLHAFAVFLVGRLDFEGALEIVQDRQQGAHGFGAGVFGELDAFFSARLREFWNSAWPRRKRSCNSAFSAASWSRSAVNAAMGSAT